MKRLIDKISYTLINLRIISTSLILFVCYILWQMWGFYQINYKALEMASGGTFTLTWMALIGILGKCLNHLLEKNYKDDK